MEAERKLFGILGHPVSHSLSPIMHNVAFAKLGLDYYYHPFNVSPAQLAPAVQALKTLGIAGVNVTIPHKESIMPYLDHLDPEAEAIGAVNTVVLAPDGHLHGYNTDGAGYVHSLRTETGISLNNKRVLMLGAGGAAKAIGVYLLKEGIRELAIANRTKEKAIRLAQHLQQYREKRAASLTQEQQEIMVLDWPSLQETGGAGFQLIINTTSVGMWPQVDQSPLTLKGLGPDTVVSDIVYNPRDTLFLKQAKAQGAQIHYGIGMLIYQGVLAFKLFTGQEAPVDVMAAAVGRFLEDKR